MNISFTQKGLSRRDEIDTLFNQAVIILKGKNPDDFPSYPAMKILEAEEDYWYYLVYVENKHVQLHKVRKFYSTTVAKGIGNCRFFIKEMLKNDDSLFCQLQLNILEQV